jgi:hypothetical protein
LGHPYDLEINLFLKNTPWEFNVERVSLQLAQKKSFNPLSCLLKIESERERAKKARTTVSTTMAYGVSCKGFSPKQNVADITFGHERRRR